MFVNFRLASQVSDNSSRMMNPRHSLDWPASISSHNTRRTSLLIGSASFNRFRRYSFIPSSLSLSIDCVSVINEKCLKYTTNLNQIADTIKQRLISTQKGTLQTSVDSIVPTIIAGAMDITQDVINLQGFERKKYFEHLRLAQSLDLHIKHLWYQLISQLTHDHGIWFESFSYPKFWELDPTENPQRERRRLKRSYCLMEKRFFQPHVPEETLYNSPLSYLFDTRHYKSINKQTVLYRHEKLGYQRRCTNVTPNNEIKGELLVGTARIYFVAEEQISTLTKDKNVSSPMSAIGYNYHSFNDDSNSFSFAIEDICEMHKRRYMLKDVGLELFFINGITLMLAHVSHDDRETLYELLTRCNLIHSRHGETVNEIQTLWRQGQMTNFDYLMKLNKLAGRTFLGKYLQYEIIEQLKHRILYS